MSSGTNRGKDTKPATLADLKKAEAKAFTHFRSVAICLDALLEVMDRRRRKGTPKVSDELRALLNTMTQPIQPPTEETKPEEPNASPSSNEG